MSKKFVVFVNADGTQYEGALVDEWLDRAKQHLSEIMYQKLNSIPELFPLLSNPLFQLDYILIPIEAFDDFENEHPINIINTLRVLSDATLYRTEDGKTHKRNVKIIASVKSTSNVQKIKEIAKLVDGLTISYSDDFTWEMIITDKKKLFSGDYSMPKAILKMIKNNKAVDQRDTNIKLTPRQQQVYSLIVKRGASNKIIAKTLNITESTVKLHIGIILKKYGLKNRTQLAVFTKDTV